MTVELVTGHTGAAHITSAQAREYQLGTYGGGVVLDTLNKLAATQDSSNPQQITIGTGSAVMPNGAHVCISSNETVSIESGRANYNRIDLIALHTSIDANNIESAELIVYRGTATTSNPSAPTLPEYPESSANCYMALYQVQLTGVTVGAPTKVFTQASRATDFLNEAYERPYVVIAHTFTVEFTPASSSGSYAGFAAATSFSPWPAEIAAAGLTEREYLDNYEPIGVVGCSSNHNQSTYVGAAYIIPYGDESLHVAGATSWRPSGGQAAQLDITVYGLCVRKELA